MYDATDFQVRYSDHQRQMTRVNDIAWQFDTVTRKPVRTTLATALISLALRLSPTFEEKDAQEAVTEASTKFPRNATIA